MKKVTTDKVLEIVNKNMDNNWGITDSCEIKCISLEQLDEDLTKIGMDSIVFIRIIVAIEEELECEIPDSKLSRNEMNTIRKITDVLQSLYYESIV